jgi:hypothetical protein
MKKLILLILTMPLLALKCKKDEPPKFYIPLDPNFMAYCAFKQGSWWTYKDLNNGQKDSVYVSYYKTENVDSRNYDYDYERLTLHTISLEDTFYYNGSPFPKGEGSQWLLQENYNVSNGTYSEWRFYYVNILPANTPDYATVDKLDSLTLSSSGAVYYDIYKIENSDSYYYNWIKTEYYARNVGVIRRELFNGAVWELTNYYIQN